MSRDDFWFGATGGFIIGVLLMTTFSIYLRDRGREECDAKLPRNEHCVQVWAPQPKEAPHGN